MWSPLGWNEGDVTLQYGAERLWPVLILRTRKALSPGSQWVYGAAHPSHTFLPYASYYTVHVVQQREANEPLFVLRTLN